jgi:hypothetical protein
LLDSLSQPEWRHHVVRNLSASEELELVLVALDRRGVSGTSGGWFSRHRHSLYHAYRWVDQGLFGRGLGALEPSDLSSVAGDCTRVEIGATPEVGGETFTETDLDRIKAYGLDAIVCFGPEPRGSRLSQVARHGVWVFRFGDARRAGGGLADPRPVLGGDPTVSASLEVLERAPGRRGAVLYESLLKADRLSHQRHARHVGRVAAEFVRRAVRRLGPDAIPATKQANAGRARENVDLPRNAEMAGLLAAFGGRLAAETMRRALYRDQWILAYTTIGEWVGARPDLSTLRTIIPPADRFWADPFPVVTEGRSYLFFEDYPHATRKGLISAVEVDADGVVGGPWAVLERDYHLSYPFLFSYQGGLFMIPESIASQAVELYRCVELPHRWEFDRVLMRAVRAADVTLAEHDGRWWMFANVAVDGALCDFEELHLFHSDGPFGPWRPHPQNPVKSDVRSARPAGRLYRRGGDWFRPAQNCALGYGHSVVINRVTRWDADGYEEVEVESILPNWSPHVKRTHTFNSHGSLFVVDGRAAWPRFLPTPRG